VLDLVLDIQGRAVDHLLFKDGGQKMHKLRAKRYVLATGGIENARLLLASRGVNPKGVGNEHDCVGRYFHDHPHVYTGTLSLFDNAASVDYQHSYAEFQADTNKVLPAVVLSQPVQEREKTLRNGFSLFANSNLDAADSYLALRRLLGQGSDTAGNHSIWDDLKLVVGDLGGAYDGVAGKIRNSFHKTHEFRMFTRAEQAPNPDSRVTLNDERDANGMPRVTLDWRFTKLDKHTLLTANALFGREIGRLGLGRVQLPDWLLRDDDSLGDEFHPGGHHMGTTRMATSPEHGVVDADCRVFGVANLYVGGSSVFPTGGYANPTLTIVQLALRMADHLKAELGSV
jgi:choline dehydrogenase-like flavoprotein